MCHKQIFCCGIIGIVPVGLAPLPLPWGDFYPQLARPAFVSRAFFAFGSSSLYVCVGYSTGAPSTLPVLGLTMWVRPQALHVTSM